MSHQPVSHHHTLHLTDAPQLHFNHNHLVDLDDPDHVHRTNTVTSTSRFVPTVLDGARQLETMRQARRTA